MGRLLPIPRAAFLNCNCFPIELGKTARYGKRTRAGAGSDFSGIVEVIGSNVPHLRSVGERVADMTGG